VAGPVRRLSSAIEKQGEGNRNIGVRKSYQVKDVGLVVSAKWPHEFHSEHRVEGDNIFLNFTVAF
jgi:hypothetical protein